MQPPAAHGTKLSEWTRTGRRACRAASSASFDAIVRKTSGSGALVRRKARILSSLPLGAARSQFWVPRSLRRGASGKCWGGGAPADALQADLAPRPRIIDYDKRALPTPFERFEPRHVQGPYQQQRALSEADASRALLGG
jgi:hypothetical protein